MSTQSYTKVNWRCGDKITQEKLAHMDEGIFNIGGVARVTIEHDADTGQYVCSESFDEIREFVSNGGYVYLVYIYGDAELVYHMTDCTAFDILFERAVINASYYDVYQFGISSDDVITHRSSSITLPIAV